MNVTVLGTHEVIAGLERATAEIQAGNLKAHAAAAVVIREAIIAEAPRGSNHTKRTTPVAQSVNARKLGDTYWVGPKRFPAMFVVGGTKPHVEPKQYTRRGNLRRNQKGPLMWPGAGHPYARVRHPGTTPDPFVERGFRRGWPAALAIWKRTI